jgi:hypothetical protein
MDKLVFILPLDGADSSIWAYPHTSQTAPAALFRPDMCVLVVEKLNFFYNLLGTVVDTSPTGVAKTGIEGDEIGMGVTPKRIVMRHN